MSETDLIVEVLSGLGQGSATIIAIVLFLKSKFEKAREASRSDFEKVLDEKIAAVQAAFRLEISEHGDEIQATKSELSGIKTQVEALEKRKREHSNALRTIGLDVARVEGRIGLKTEAG